MPGRVGGTKVKSEEKEVLKEEVPKLTFYLDGRGCLNVIWGLDTNKYEVEGMLVNYLRYLQHELNQEWEEK